MGTRNAGVAGCKTLQSGSSCSTSPIIPRDEPFGRCVASTASVDSWWELIVIIPDARYGKLQGTGQRISAINPSGASVFALAHDE